MTKCHIAIIPQFQNRPGGTWRTGIVHVRKSRWSNANRERDTEDRRQKTEDRGLGCMSLRILQPSSFVFCPLSFALPIYLKTSYLKMGKLHLPTVMGF